MNEEQKTDFDLNYYMPNWKLHLHLYIDGSKENS